MQSPNTRPRRRMSRQQYEALMRKRKRRNRIAIASMGAIAALIVVVVVLILSPRRPAKDVLQTQPAEATAAPVVAADVGGADLSDPRDGSGDAMIEATPVPTVTPIPTATPVPTPKPTGTRSARFRMIGDVMVCESQLKAYKSSGYDFHVELAGVADILSNADFTMANMEGTVGRYKETSYSGYPQFNCPETILAALKDSGVDFLTLANNHMLDKFFDGMKNTVGWVREYGLKYVGAYRTQEERNTPVIYEINGIKVGFVAYTHTTNSIETRVKLDPGATKYGVPYLYKADIAGDIKRLREAGAEVVIALPHWGAEYVREPDDTQKKYARKLAMAGADIILGSHSHMVQPMDYVDFVDANGQPKRIFMIFSMGNFLSDHVLQYTDCGVVLDFTVSVTPDGAVSCDNVGYIPTYCWQPTEGDVRVIPSGKYLDKAPAGMSDEAYSRMVASYYEIVEVLGNKFQVLNA